MLGGFACLLPGGLGRTETPNLLLNTLNDVVAQDDVHTDIKAEQIAGCGGLQPAFDKGESLQRLATVRRVEHVADVPHTWQP